VRKVRQLRRAQLLSIVAALLVSAGLAYAQTGGGFDLAWFKVADGGGTFSAGGAYSLGGTAGQVEAGSMSGGAYGLTGGFWAATASTPTAATNLVGHVTWQGRPAQPNALQQIPITLTLRSRAGGPDIAYTGMTTDPNGFFTVTTSASAGAYNWRVKSAQVGAGQQDYNPGWLAVTGTLTLVGAPVTNLEMGLQRAGDCNNDNLVNSQDFIILKIAFGRSAGQFGYDNRADFTGDQIIGSTDFVQLKNNFGFGGAPPIGP
jgi:hypothetical protein